MTRNAPRERLIPDESIQVDSWQQVRHRSYSDLVLPPPRGKQFVFSVPPYWERDIFVTKKTYFVIIIVTPVRESDRMYHSRSCHCGSGSPPCSMSGDVQLQTKRPVACRGIFRTSTTGGQNHNRSFNPVPFGSLDGSNESFFDADVED